MDEQHSQPIRDLDHSTTTAWPRLEYPFKDRPNGSSVPVVCKQSVLSEIHRHGQSRTEVEICGVLVGNGYQDDSGPFVYVEASIRGEFAGNQLAQVTFTHETWAHIQDELDRRHPGKRIMGWYHTHPGFGIFLSPMDLFIHENFFDSPEQLALVYDPLSGDEGIFVWRLGKPCREPVKIEEDTAVEPIVAAQREHGELMTAAAGPAGGDLPTRLSRLEQRQRWFIACLALLAIVAIVWPIVLPHVIEPLGGADHHRDRPSTKEAGERTSGGPAKGEPSDASGGAISSEQTVKTPAHTIPSHDNPTAGTKPASPTTQRTQQEPGR